MNIKVDFKQSEYTCWIVQRDNVKKMIVMDLAGIPYNRFTV